jgi:ParB-like nuclease domain
MSKKKQPLKIFEPVMLPVDQLVWDDNNPNIQDKSTAKLVKANIEEQGFDENLLVIPLTETTEDGRKKYKVVSGNHKGRYAVEAGADKLPVTIREDWDMLTSALQSVRRNVSRGAVEPAAYTAIVKAARDSKLEDNEIMTRMGIHQQHVFEQNLIKKVLDDEQASRLQHTGASVSQGEAEQQDVAGRIKLIDNVGYVVSEILDKYGHTIPYSFIVFPVSQGGCKHMYVQATAPLKTVISHIAKECMANGQDLSSVLAGLLNKGLASSNMSHPSADPGDLDAFDEFSIEEGAEEQDPS